MSHMVGDVVATSGGTMETVGWGIVRLPEEDDRLRARDGNHSRRDDDPNHEDDYN